MSWGIRAHIRNVMLKASLGATFSSTAELKGGSAAMCTVEMCPYPGFDDGSTGGGGGPSIHHPPPTDDNDFLKKQMKLTSEKFESTTEQLKPASSATLRQLLLSETLENLIADLFWHTYLSKFGLLYAAEEIDPQAMESFKSVLTDMFIESDADGSGEVDAAELSVILSALGIQLPESVCGDLINLVDDNGNGTLELDEFLQMMCVEVISDCEKATIRKHIEGYRSRCCKMWNELLPPVAMDIKIRDDVAPVLCRAISMTITCCFRLCFKKPTKPANPGYGTAGKVQPKLPTNGFDAIFRYEVEENIAQMLLGARKPLIPARPSSARNRPSLGKSQPRLLGGSLSTATSEDTPRPTSARRTTLSKYGSSSTIAIGRREIPSQSPKTLANRVKPPAALKSSDLVASSILQPGPQGVSASEADHQLGDYQVSFADFATSTPGGGCHQDALGLGSRLDKDPSAKQEADEIKEVLLQMQVSHRPHLYDSPAGMKRLKKKVGKDNDALLRRTLTTYKSARQLQLAAQGEEFDEEMMTTGLSSPKKKSSSDTGGKGLMSDEFIFDIPLPPRTKGQPEPAKPEMDMLACSPSFSEAFEAKPASTQRLKLTQRENYAADFIPRQYSTRWSLVKKNIAGKFERDFGPDAPWRTKNRDEEHNLDMAALNAREDTSGRALAKHTRRAQRELAEKRHEVLTEAYLRFGELEHTWNSFAPFLGRKNEVREDRPLELKEALEELRTEFHALIEGEEYRFLDTTKRNQLRRYSSDCFLAIKTLERELQFRKSRNQNLAQSVTSDELAEERREVLRRFKV